MVAHAFPRVEGDLPGAFVWRLAEALVDRGHEVSTLAPADEGEVGETMLGRVGVRRVRYAGARYETLAYHGTMFQRLTRSPVAAVTFARLVRALSQAVNEEILTSGVHVVHAHWWIPGGLAVRNAPRHGRTFVCTVQGDDVALARRLPGGRSWMAGVLRQATTVTAVSKSLAAEVAGALDVRRETIAVTPMPLALGIGADPDQPRSGAIFVGPLRRRKGVHHLLEAAAILKRNGQALDLTIVGDGPERGNLKAQALALGLNAVFTGFVAPELVPGYLRDKRVFVLPALDDDPGLVAAEALTQGVPVVATRAGGIPDVMADPGAGILVPPSDPAMLASAIRSVLLEERFRFGAYHAGRVLADHLSPERVAERFEALYTRTRASRTSLGQPAVG